MRRKAPSGAPVTGRLPLFPLLWGCLLSAWAGEGIDDDWILRGTLASGGGRGQAILESPHDSRRQTIVRVGETLFPGVRLLGVWPDSVELGGQGRRWRLRFGARIGGTPLPEAESRARRLSLHELPRLVSGIDAVPHQQKGRVVGYYINAVSESLRPRTGLRPGDLVYRVNGVPLADPGAVVRLLEAVRPGAQVTLEVKRAGRPLQLSYRIAP